MDQHDSDSIMSLIEVCSTLRHCEALGDLKIFTLNVDSRLSCTMACLYIQHITCVIFNSTGECCG